MKIKVLRTTFVSGKLIEKSNKPVEVSDDDGARLIALGKAEKVEDKKAAAK